MARGARAVREPERARLGVRLGPATRVMLDDHGLRRPRYEPNALGRRLRRVFYGRREHELHAHRVARVGNGHDGRGHRDGFATRVLRLAHDADILREGSERLVIGVARLDRRAGGVPSYLEIVARRQHLVRGRLLGDASDDTAHDAASRDQPGHPVHRTRQSHWRTERPLLLSGGVWPCSANDGLHRGRAGSAQCHKSPKNCQTMKSARMR
ncbi:unnamed protein product [Pelagomonas calceolata]|uniref:Uncharacterized protein n=1 Tax=Pelagomonas calceolata TaxID=35677 RepID=A0A8J2SVL2_9STRA|nr:unnamed protein product [Pelagomonas calceolata]